MELKPTLLLLMAAFVATNTFAQEEDLLKKVVDDSAKKEYVTGAFKSSRVVMSHSMEMLNSGVLDFRILHRFGNINGGFSEFFGLDGPGEAVVRIGLDYGLTNNLSIGIGRSAQKKELDGFLKYRPVQQATGIKASPRSLVLVGGITNQADATAKTKPASDRVSYYWQAIIGRKFSSAFTLQTMPLVIHRNGVDFNDRNDVFAEGLGGRLKLSKRISLNVDYYYVVNQRPGQRNPLSIGFDIETGGHVFQLHFTNATGINERAFIIDTESNWGDGDVSFGFNISRVFQLKKKKG